LEIKKLQQETGTAARVEGFLPFFTALLALAGATAGFYRWSNDRAKDRRLRVEAGFDENLSRLIDFPSAERPSNAAVVTALANLIALIDQAEPERRADMTDRVTGAIATAVADDLDFDSLPHSSFESLCYAGWEPWRERLAVDVRQRTFVLYRYRQALRRLHDADAHYFETMRQDSEGAYVVHEYTEEKRYLHFSRLTDGYRAHVEGLTDDGERSAAIAGYGSALHNTELAAQVFASVVRGNG
jgi:hypothetical protein